VLAKCKAFRTATEPLEESKDQEGLQPLTSKDNLSKNCSAQHESCFEK